MKLRIFDGGKKAMEDAAAREAEVERQALIDERRMAAFDRQPMRAADLLSALRVPYEHWMLRAVVQVIRTAEARAKGAAMMRPMEESAHEMCARQAALRELEEELLGLVDRASENAEGD